MDWCFIRLTGMCVGLLLSLLVTPAATADENASRNRHHRQILEKRQLVVEGLQRELESLQTWCLDRSLTDAVEEVAAFRRSFPNEDSMSELSNMVRPPIDASLPPDEQHWQTEFRRIRTQRSSELYTLSLSALKAGFPSLAFAMIGDVLQVNPDHEWARRIQGRELFRDPQRDQEPGYAGEWVSAFEKQMRSGNKPHVNHPDFGWIPVSSVAKYEAGQRPWKSSWISASKENLLRQDFQNAWEVRSEHFLVKTNVSLEAGIVMSRNLETYYNWLHENFAAFFETPRSLQEQFENRTRRTRTQKQPMEVQYFATREEYERRLRGKLPPNQVTEGVYWNDDQISYFFVNPERRGFSTLYHEATHQILDMATRTDRVNAARAKARRLNQRSIDGTAPGRDSNFWLVEGLATYLESFEIVDGRVSVGRPDFIRFENARQRLIDPERHFFLPTKSFCAMGQQQFMSDPNLSPLYSQAAGFTHFLMHYEDGLYRDDLISLLSAVYRPDPKATEEPSLARIARVPFTEFDHQYRSHMENLTDLQITRSRTESDQ